MLEGAVGGSLIVSSTLAFVCQECAHAQALNRYIRYGSTITSHTRVNLHVSHANVSV